MVINVRLGFQRLARVTAIAYTLVAVLSVIVFTLSAWNERQRDLHPLDFKVMAQDGRAFEIRAARQDEAQSAAERYVTAHPAADSSSSDAQRLAAAEIYFGKPTPPIRLSLPQYEHPPTIYSVLWRGLITAFGFAMYYGVFWAFFRVARWVLSGFMTPVASDRANA